MVWENYQFNLTFFDFEDFSLFSTFFFVKRFFFCVGSLSDELLDDDDELDELDELESLSLLLLLLPLLLELLLLLDELFFSSFSGITGVGINFGAFFK